MWNKTARSTKRLKQLVLAAARKACFKSVKSVTNTRRMRQLATDHAFSLRPAGPVLPRAPPIACLYWPTTCCRSRHVTYRCSVPSTTAVDHVSLTHARSDIWLKTWTPKRGLRVLDLLRPVSPFKLRVKSWELSIDINS